MLSTPPTMHKPPPIYVVGHRHSGGVAFLGSFEQTEMHGCRCKGVRSAVEHTTAAGRGGPFVRFASGLSSPGCMLETITSNLEFYALRARARPGPRASGTVYTRPPGPRPRAPSCVEGGVADSPARVPRGCSTVVPHSYATDAGGCAAYFSEIDTNLFRSCGRRFAFGGRCGL